MVTFCWEKSLLATWPQTPRVFDDPVTDTGAFLNNWLSFAFVDEATRVGTILREGVITVAPSGMPLNLKTVIH